MTSRERVLETLSFCKTDRAPCDLMDGRIWPELYDYFAMVHGLHDRDSILDFLGTDFRWIEVAQKEAGGAAKSAPHQVTAETTDTSDGPLHSARTVADVVRRYQGGRSQERDKPSAGHRDRMSPVRRLDEVKAAKDLVLSYALRMRGIAETSGLSRYISTCRRYRYAGRYVREPTTGWGALAIKRLYTS